MNAEKENEIIREKMTRMMTGLPWRLWSVIRDRDFKYFKRKYALERAQETLKDIERRAMKGAMMDPLGSNNKVNATDQGESVAMPWFYGSSDKAYSELGKLNASMGKMTQTLEGEINWVIHALGCALRAETYNKAEGFVNFLRLHMELMSQQQRNKSAHLILNQYMATGEREAATAFLFSMIDSLNMTDEIASLTTLLFGPEGASSSLPSGSINSLRMSHAQEIGVSESEFARDALSMAEKFKENPQNKLIIANFYRNKSERVYMDSVNSFLDNYKMTRIRSVDPIRFFETVQFEPSEPITGGPKVSIIMAAFNALNTIEASINSLLSQTYRNIEILVADDCSEDGTAELVAMRYRDEPRVRLFRGKANQGCYNLRNLMIQQAVGELITFQDADDVAIPNRIEIQVKEVLAGNIIACYGRWVRVLEDGKFIFFKDQAALRMSVVSLMAHRSVFAHLPPYRSVRFGADTEFLETIRKVYGPESVGIVRRPLIFGRWSASSLTQAAGQEASLDGYRGPARRTYAEGAFMQRLLGKTIVPDEIFNQDLRAIGVLREAQEIQPFFAKLETL
ncbi:MAG: glycosyltransferase family 2 protein [Pseudomonadota bacterium]